MINNDIFNKDLVNKLVSDVGIAFWIWDIPTSKLFYNSSFFKLIGYEVQTEAVDLEWWQNIIHPDDREVAMKKFNDFISGKTSKYNVECRAITKNGDVMWVLNSGKFTNYDENGQPELFCGTCHDITKRKSYEEKLKLAMKFTDFSIWECDIKTKEVYFEDDYLTSLGYKADHFESTVENWLNLTHPDDILNTSTHLQKCFLGETTKYDVKCRIKCGDGEYIWVRDIGEIIKFDSDGKPLKMLGSRINITQQEIAQLELKDQQEKLKLAMGYIDFSIWECDVVTKDVKFEDDYLISLGYEADYFDSTVENWLSLTHKDDVEEATVTLKKCFYGETDIYDQKSRVRKGDGEYIWIRDIGKVVSRDADGNPLKMLGGRINITQQENSRLKLKDQQEKLKMAMEFADFSIWEWDVQLNKVVHDEEYIKTLGYNINEFENDISNWLDIIHVDDIDRVNKHLELCFKGIETSYDQKLRIRKGNGEYIWVHDVGKISQTDANNTPLKIVGGRVNINELETSKLKLENYQKKLEDLIKQRTKDLLRRDTILMELNQMSQKLMATPQGENFNDTVYECLNEFSVVGENARFSIFRHKSVDEFEYCYLASNNGRTYKNEFSRDIVHDIFKDISVSFASEGRFNENSREEFYSHLIETMSNIDLNTIDYKKEYPTIFSYVTQNKILNAQTSELTPKELIFTKLQGVQSILVAPITIANQPWGFIILDYFEEKAFTEDDEKMLVLVGSVLAQAIHKNELEILANEALEHNRLMLDSIPMCCNLWLDGNNISTNDEAVRLFDLENQQQYLDNFHLLSPEYQPSGEKSSEKAAEYVQTALETGYERFEWLHQNLKGEEIPCEITLVRIPHRDHFYVSGCTRDLREIKQILQNYEETQVRLEEAHEEAVLSSKAKSNFLANMSHEIRTPMNAISGMTDIIIRDTNNSDIKDYAKNIKRASDSLLSIINDVLDISKIESGKLDIVEGEYDLSDTLNDVLTIANNRLQDKNLLFVTNFQHDLPCKVIGDDIRIKQIIVNILNNAIKFTEAGSITFDVKGEFGGGLLELTFSVTDTGIGISEEDIEKLFIEFERVNTTKNRTIEGTGLGLAISKRLCEMMNGFFKVESEIGKGSTFSVTIFQKYKDYSPLAQIKEEKLLLIFESRDLYLNSIKQSCEQLGLKNTIFCSSQSEFNEALHQQTFDFIFTTQMYLLKVQEMMLQYKLESKIILLADNDTIKSKYDYDTIVLPTNTMDIANIINGKHNSENNKSTVTKFIAPDAKILVVDDNTVNLKVAQGLLSPYKAKLETAENGKQALEKIKNNNYDIVFMDHMMPIMDGIDATIAIRGLEGDYYKNLPIIALTANAIVGTKEMFFREGMNDFIAKPIKLSALNDALAKWLPTEKQIKQDSLVENNDYIKAVELEKLNQIDIKGVNTKLGISQIGGDFNTYIDIVRMYHKDGLKRVVNILNLFETNQLLDFKIEVHALKSASASIGAIEVSELARLLEDAVNINNDAYVRENTQEFLDEFNDLLKNIEISIKDLIGEDNENKELGDISLFYEILPKLSDALDNIDMSNCESLLEQLIKLRWNEKESQDITKIKDAIDSYEFDDAIEIIENILNN